MIQRAPVVVGIALAVSISGCARQSTGIEAAAEAMGATNLNSIQFSGSGLVFGSDRHKAAIANGGTLAGNVITVTIEGREFKATLNDQNLVERVSYLSTNPVVGDYPVEVAYSDFAEFGAVQFPTHIVETQDGHPTLDITIDDVTPNAAVSLDVPANVQQAPAAAETPIVTAEKLADGVWYIAAAGIRSWAVEFRDHVVVVEGPTSEARSLAVNHYGAAAFGSTPDLRGFVSLGGTAASTVRAGGTSAACWSPCGAARRAARSRSGT